MKFRGALFATLAGFALPVAANDTTATVGVGGLQFVQNDNVRMVSEDLYLSMDEVRVKYVFENLTDTEQHVLVAFPMPDITGEYFSPNAYPTDDPENVFGFQTTFNGEPVAAELHQTVFALGVDRTKELTKYGLPLAPHLVSTEEAIHELSVEDRMYLASIGAITSMDFGGGETVHAPLWTLKSSYLWEAVFPVGETVEVEHSYKPGVGGTVAATFLDPEYGALAEYQKKYCLEDNIVQAVAKTMKESNLYWSAPYTESWLSYVLSTGANWAGPIGSFRVTVDKGDETNFVSFCGEGITKTGPTTFEWTEADFHPWQDIEVLFLVRRDDY